MSAADWCNHVFAQAERSLMRVGALPTAGNKQPSPPWLQPKPLKLLDTIVDCPKKKTAGFTFYKQSPILVPLIPFVAASIALDAGNEALRISPILSTAKVKIINYGGGRKMQRGEYMKRFERDSVVKCTLNLAVAPGSSNGLNTNNNNNLKSTIYRPRALIDLFAGAAASVGEVAAASSDDISLQQHAAAMSAAIGMVSNFPNSMKVPEPLLFPLLQRTSCGVWECRMWIERCYDLLVQLHECEWDLPYYPPTRFSELKKTVRRELLIASIFQCITGVAVLYGNDISPVDPRKWTSLFSRVTEVFLPVIVNPANCQPLFDAQLVSIDSNSAISNDRMKVAQAAWMLRQLASRAKGRNLLERFLCIVPWEVSAVLSVLLLMGCPELHGEVLREVFESQDVTRGRLPPSCKHGSLEQLLAIRTVAIPGMINTHTGQLCPRCNSYCLGDVLREERFPHQQQCHKLDQGPAQRHVQVEPKAQQGSYRLSQAPAQNKFGSQRGSYRLGQGPASLRESVSQQECYRLGQRPIGQGKPVRHGSDYYNSVRHAISHDNDAAVFFNIWGASAATRQLASLIK